MEKYIAILTSEINNIIHVEGRLNRERYFTIAIACFLINVLLSLLGMMLPFIAFVTILVSFVCFVWTITATVRRLHDTNRSGWWTLCAIIPIVGFVLPWIFTLLPGDTGMNRYG